MPGPRTKTKSKIRQRSPSTASAAGGTAPSDRTSGFAPTQADLENIFHAEGWAASVHALCRDFRIPDVSTRSGLKKAHKDFEEINAKLLVIWDYCKNSIPRNPVSDLFRDRVTATVVALYTKMSVDIILRNRIFCETAFLSMALSLLDAPSASHLVLQSLVTVTHHAPESFRIFIAKRSVPAILSHLDANPNDLVAAELAAIVLTHCITSAIGAKEVPEPMLLQLLDIPHVVRTLLAFMRKPGATSLFWEHTITLFCSVALHCASTLRDQPSAVNLLVALARSPDLRARAVGVLGVLRLHVMDSEDPPWQFEMLKIARAMEGPWPAHLDAVGATYGPERLEVWRIIQATYAFEREMLRVTETRDIATLGVHLAELTLSTEFAFPQGGFETEDPKTGKRVSSSLGLPWTRFHGAPPHCAAALRARGEPGDADRADILDIKSLLTQYRTKEAQALARTAIARSPHVPFFHHALTLDVHYATGVRAAQQGLHCGGAGPGSPGHIRHSLLYYSAKHGSELALMRLHMWLIEGKQLEEGFAAALCAFESADAFVHEAPPDTQTMTSMIGTYTLMMMLVRGHELRDDLPELREANKRFEIADDFARFLGYSIRHTQIRAARSTVLDRMSAAQQEWGALVRTMADGAPKAVPTPDAEEEALAAWLERMVTEDVDDAGAPGSREEEGSTHMQVHPRVTVNNVELYRCSWCGTPSAVLRRCGGCQKARYCGAGCQKLHWTGGHRKLCVRGEKEAESKERSGNSAH
ncbi:hypothetical protein BC834DRAFT_890419 [Gloeopeniophorella convolvens]|nr:hypothetical protein BC834DRAFT_890419 [Gloeopeniophorella convolvens]